MPQRRPDLFRSVCDVGLVPGRCSCESGISKSCSPRWLPAWLPVDDGVTPWSSSPSPGLFPAIWPRPVLPQAPPPNPVVAEPDGRRVLSRGGVADHAVTPQAPLTGSGCREHSYGGFGEATQTSTRTLTVVNVVPRLSWLIQKWTEARCIDSARVASYLRRGL